YPPCGPAPDNTPPDRKEIGNPCRWTFGSPAIPPEAPRVFVHKLVMTAFRAEVDGADDFRMHFVVEILLGHPAGIAAGLELGEVLAAAGTRALDVLVRADAVVQDAAPLLADAAEVFEVGEGFCYREVVERGDELGAVLAHGVPAGTDGLAALLD